MLTLISATPSPFARMNRIALQEKGIPFELQNEVPWDSTTQTPQYNPLEKLPILIFDDGREPIYDSAYIQEYIVAKYADKGPRLLTGNIDDDLKARQIQTLAEGLMDAFVLDFFEERRGPEHRSEEWSKRQNRKIDGAMRAFEQLAKNRSSDSGRFLIGDQLTIGDIAAVCAVAQIDFGGLRPTWKQDYPHLKEYVEDMEKIESFNQTRPVMFDLKDSVV